MTWSSRKYSPRAGCAGSRWLERNEWIAKASPPCGRCLPPRRARSAGRRGAGSSTPSPRLTASPPISPWKPAGSGMSRRNGRWRQAVTRHRVLLFFHGGGYCSGSLESHRGMVAESGRAAGMRTLAVGYRLAPEDPFPAALDDALAAYRFLLEDGMDPGQSRSAATAPAAASRWPRSSGCARPAGRFRPVPG